MGASQQGKDNTCHLVQGPAALLAQVGIICERRVDALEHPLIACVDAQTLASPSLMPPSLFRLSDTLAGTSIVGSGF